MDLKTIEKLDLTLDTELDSNLKDFYNQNKPKDIAPSLKHYTKLLDPLGYSLLQFSNKLSLITQRTYVRYIPHTLSVADKEYKTHIRPGGILVSGGNLDYNDPLRGYVPNKNVKTWTHLVLMYKPKDKNKGGEAKVKTKSKTKSKTKGKVIEVDLAEDPKIRFFKLSLKKNYVYFRNTTAPILTPKENQAATNMFKLLMQEALVDRKRH